MTNTRPFFVHSILFFVPFEFRIIFLWAIKFILSCSATYEPNSHLMESLERMLGLDYPSFCSSMRRMSMEMQYVDLKSKESIWNTYKANSHIES